MRLKVPFNELKQSVNQYIDKLKVIPTDSRTEEEFASAEQAFEEWQNDCVSFLKSVLENDTLEFMKDIRVLGKNGFVIPNAPKLDLYSRLRNFGILVNSARMTLEYNVRILSLCDPIVIGDSFDTSEREHLDTDGKMEFLLRKLKQADTGESHYPAKFILEENGLKLNYGEANELVREMLNYGLVESFGGMGTPQVKISILGKRTIEQIDREANRQSEPNPTKTIYANNYVENANHSVLQQGNTGGVQNASLTIANNQLEDIKVFLTELKEAIKELHLQKDEKEELASDVEMIELLSKSSKPKAGVMKEVFKSVKSILEKASVSAISTGIVNKAPALIAKVEALIHSFPQ